MMRRNGNIKGNSGQLICLDSQLFDVFKPKIFIMENVLLNVVKDP